MAKKKSPSSSRLHYSLTLITTSHKTPKNPSTENLGFRVGRDNICMALGHRFQQVHTGFALKLNMLQGHSSRELSQVGRCESQLGRCKPKLHRLCTCPFYYHRALALRHIEVMADLPLTAIAGCIPASQDDMVHRPPTCHIQDTCLDTLLTP